MTNGAEARQRPKMHDALDQLFDAVFFAFDEPVSKPDPEAFRLVAERAGAALEGAWMVGDSLTDDVAAGAAVGMSTIWVSNGKELPDPVPGGVRPDVTVTSVAQAFEIMAREDPH